MVNKTSSTGWPRALAASILVSALLLGAPLQAQVKAQKLLERGRYLVLKKNNCYKALAVLEEARKLATTSRVRGAIYLNIAVCTLALGNRQAALVALREALIHNPGLAKYSSRYNKGMQSLFAEIKPRHNGMLSVISNHPDSVVYIDGREAGPAPFLKQVPVGTHRVEVRTRDGRWRHRESVIVGKDGYVSVNSTLKEVQGMLTVLSSPSGVRVYVDGEIVGSTPVHKTPVAPGSHTITVRSAGYRVRTRRVKISPDRLTSINFALAGPPGQGAAVDLGLIRPIRQHRRIWTWVAAGGALAALTVGVGVGISIKSDAETYANTSEDQTQRLDDLEQTMRAKALSSNILFGVSGALAVTSVVFFFWEGGWFSREQKRSSTSSISGKLTPIIGDGAAGILWTADF